MVLSDVSSAQFSILIAATGINLTKVVSSVTLLVTERLCAQF